MEADAKRRSRRILVILVAAVLLVAGVIVAWQLLRPRSLAEVLAMGSWQPGGTITVEGTVADVQRYETTYGPIVALGLDGQGVCGLQGSNPGGILGDPNATYVVGDRFQTTLHFSEYRFNGVRAVWAPELLCPMPVMFQSIARVYDAISGLGGILLAFNGTDAQGWASYEIVTPYADAFRPDVLPVTLRKAMPFTTGTIDSATRWTTVAALEYVTISGGYEPNPVVDDMPSLAAGSSRNGTLRYADVNANGLTDDGDRLDVRLAGVGAGNEYETYMIQIGELRDYAGAYAYGGHYLLNGPRGPFEPLWSDRDPLVELRYLGDRPGNPVASDLEVARVWFGAPLPVSEMSYTIMVNNTYATGVLSQLPAVVLGNVSIAYSDANVNGFLDAGDSVAIANLPNRTSLSFQLLHAGTPVGEQRWTTGYGRQVGRAPSFTLEPVGANPTHVGVTVAYWHPDLVLTGTLRVSLSQNDVAVITDVPLANATAYGFAGGNLTFLDVDGDGYLSTGDEFLVQETPGARYDLTVSFFGVPFRSTFFFS